MAEKVPIPQFIKGIVRESAVDHYLSPQDSVELSLNLHGDTIGSMKLRKGLTLLGTQLVDNTAILGMGQYRNNAGSNYKALAKVGTVVMAYDGASWTNVRTALTATSKARFTNFVDYAFMVNGTGNEVCSTYNGSSSFGSVNVASLPAGDFIDNYRSRIWVAQSTTDKVYYSDVVTTNNTITGGTAFIQVSPQDGEKITGLTRHARALLVFKNNHIYRIFSINSTDPDPTINVGTYSQESIIEGKDGISYHHPTGFYNFVFDGEQKEISRPIIDVIKAIPRSYYESISGWVDDDHKYWSIGDITLDGIAFTNVVCRYTISTQVWTLYSYGTEIRSAALYDNGTDLIQLVGDDDGNVLKFDVGNTDNGTPIYYDLQTHWMTFTASKVTGKTFSELATLHENAKGSNISYQLDIDKGSQWRAVSQIKKDLQQVDTIDAKDFIRIRFRFAGNSSGTPFSFKGWELHNFTVDGETKKN